MSKNELEISKESLREFLLMKIDTIIDTYLEQSKENISKEIQSKINSLRIKIENI